MNEPLLLAIPIVMFIIIKGAQFLHLLPSALTFREWPPQVFLVMLVSPLTKNLFIDLANAMFTGH